MSQNFNGPNAQYGPSHGLGVGVNADGRPTSFSGRSKKEPVWGVPSAFPCMMYNIDRTFVTVHNQEEMDKLLAQNVKGEKPKWARSPAAWGIETAPSLPEVSERPGTW